MLLHLNAQPLNLDSIHFRFLPLVVSQFSVVPPQF
jgi:hypothetical protein